MVRDDLRRLGRADQITLVRKLRIALSEFEKKGQNKGGIAEQLGEALYLANVGLEPEYPGLINDLFKLVMDWDISELNIYSGKREDDEGNETQERKTNVLQDLRRKIYTKAKAEPAWRFWGLYVHVCKMETIREAYRMAKENNGAPGIDGVTFKAIEERGVEAFLEDIRNELVNRTYRPMRNRKKQIPKDAERKKFRTLSIPSIRDRVVQGALKLILEPVFEADFQPGSYAYRPKRKAHQAIEKVAKAISQRKWWVIDLDLRAYFDNIRHHILFGKVAKRVNDDDIMHLLKLIVKATGKKGVPQGGVISPLLSNLYLNEIDKMMERAKEVTKRNGYMQMEYARFADDMVVLVDAHPRQDWLLKALQKRLREEFENIQVEVNEEKSRVVDLGKGESFGFLGFDFQVGKGRSGKLRPVYTPKSKKRKKLIAELSEVFAKSKSRPIVQIIRKINPILRGWVNFFRVGSAAACFSYVRHWVEKKVRRHMMRARGRQGFGWKRWSTEWLHEKLGLFSEYRVLHWKPAQKALPCQ